MAANVRLFFILSDSFYRISDFIYKDKRAGFGKFVLPEFYFTFSNNLKKDATFGL